jgi:phosphoribosylformylglycinamidine synthase
VDLEAERSLSQLLVEGVGLLTSAHDLSDGGLSQALVESGLRRGIGASVALAEDPFVALFSETTARALVTVPSADADALVALAARHGVPIASLGETGGDALVVQDVFTLPLEELRAAWTATLPAALG